MGLQKLVKIFNLKSNSRPGKLSLESSPPSKTLFAKPSDSKSLKRNPEWSTILRRQDGSVNFQRNWTDYKYGFGDPNGEYFFGLENLHLLTTYVAPQKLLIILEDWQNETRYAEYNLFRIGSESEKYALLELGTYRGDAGDSLKQHHGMKFSTDDQDNDTDGERHCAKIFEGAWWYYNCYFSHLTGPFRQEIDKNNKGIEWVSWKAGEHSLKSAEMLIRAIE